MIENFDLKEMQERQRFVKNISTTKSFFVIIFNDVGVFFMAN